MPGKHAGRSGRRWRRARTWVFDNLPDVCHLCGHAGTTDADHDPPRVELLRLGLDPDDPQYLRRAHGVVGCPVCGKRCNQRKGARSGYSPARTSRVW